MFGGSAFGAEAIGAVLSEEETAAEAAAASFPGGDIDCIDTATTGTDLGSCD